MSYITATKDLLGDDLSKLISHVSHLKIGTPEYKKLEDFAWRQIFRKYHTSITDDNVKTCIDGFSEKFIFHGFAQKAENLRLLVRHYSNLDYFKNQTDGTLKWGLIFFLTRLSHRPTDCDEDDDPIDIRALLRPENAEEPILDWPAYLKEGWEKFRLPSDDGSEMASDDDASRNDFDLNDIPKFREDTHRPGFPLGKANPSQPQLTLAEFDKLCLETANEVQSWVESHYPTPWWKIPNYSETAPAKRLPTDYCYVWAARFKDRGKENVRVISESKIILELLYVLGTANGSSSYLFDCHGGTYSVKNNLSVPSLSPPMFHSVMESQFCKYLPHIANLVQFTEKVSQLPLMDEKISNTYVAYSKAIGDILNSFRTLLTQAEIDWSKGENVVTLRKLFSQLQPWFDSFQFLSHIHSKAVYTDFSQVEPWRCSLRLLSVLLHEMKWISNSRFKKLALGLFLNSVRIYLRIIASMIRGDKNADPKKEFLIYTFGEDRILQIHKYSSILMENNISTEEFWDPFVTSCFLAISSTQFIIQLHKRSTFSKAELNTNVLMLDVIEELKECLSSVADINEEEERPVINEPVPCQTWFGFGIEEPFYAKTPMTTGSRLVRSIFTDSLESKPLLITQDTPVDKFVKSLEESNLTTFPINFFLTRIFVSTIKKYMEPVGFAYDTLIHEFKLLDHLKCLRRVFFIQILEPFVQKLFHEIARKSLAHLDWTGLLRNSISDHYDTKWAHQYRCTVTHVPLISSNHPKFIHESLSFTKVYYQPEAHLKTLVPDSCIKAYNEIFKFLLQVKWAHHVITNKFQLKGVIETPDNISLLRRMYLLRLRLVHTMTTFRYYFFSMDESGFEAQIKDLCVKARDLQTIARAHKDFLVKCKLHCFLNRKNECKLLADALLVMCFKCVKLWVSREEISTQNVDALEEEYYRVSSNLVAALQKRESDYSGSMKCHYALLLNDLSAYVPPTPCSRSTSIEMSSANNVSTFSHFNQSVKFSSSGFKDV